MGDCIIMRFAGVVVVVVEVQVVRCGVLTIKQISCSIIIIV